MMNLLGTAAAPIEVLLVEDSPGDVRLTREALRDAKVQVVLNVVSDGVEAMEFLARTGKFSNAPRPNIILLDLNLPRLDGREVLEAIKRDPSLMSIPVIILTTSESHTDIIRSYRLNANCFVTKPVDLDVFIQVFHFWLSLARLPQETA